MEHYANKPTQCWGHWKHDSHLEKKTGSTSGVFQIEGSLALMNNYKKRNIDCYVADSMINLIEDLKGLSVGILDDAYWGSKILIIVSWKKKKKLCK